MKKANKFYIISLIAILTVSLFVTIVMADSKIAFATGNENLTLEKQNEQNTSTDSPNGISISAYIEDFRNACAIPYYMYNLSTPVSKRSLFSNGCSFSIANISSATVDADDNITKIIPKEYFTSVCEELYIGKEYGFYINTNYEPNNNTTFLRNTVILIDVVPIANQISLIDIKLTPLVQLEFVTFSSTANVKTPRTSALTVAEYYCNYSTSLSQSVVAPRMYYTLGTNTNDKVEFCEIERFRLHDISTVALINNQNALNAGDIGYDANDDKGYFFTGNNYYFSATQRISEGNIVGSVGEVVTTMLDHGMGYVLSNNQLSELGDFFGISGMAFDIVSSIVESTRVFEYSASNDRYEAVHLYNTRSTQIANYEGNLIKESHILLNTSGTDRMYFLTGDYSRAQFVISSYDNSEEYEYSQMAIMYGMRIENVKNNDTTVGILQSNITYYDINTPQTTPIQMGQPANTYILPGGSQHFDFTPTVNGVAVGGKYVLDVGSNDVDVYIDDVKQTVTNGLCEFDVTQGVASNIVLKNVSTTKYRRAISISPKAVANGDSVSVLAGKKYLVKYVPTTTDIYTLGSSEIEIVGAYEYHNEAFTRVQTLTDSFVEGNSIDNLCFANTSYYLVLHNKEQYGCTTTLTMTPISDRVQVGNNSNINIPATRYKLYSFTTPNVGQSNYSFVFNNSPRLSYMLMSTTGQTCEIENAGQGYFKALNLAPNTEYYFGIKSAEQTSLSLEIIASNEDPFVWKVYDGETLLTTTSTNRYHLAKGKEYRVELWIGNTRYMDIAHFADSLDIDNNVNTGFDFDSATGTMSLESNRDYNSTVLLALKKYNNSLETDYTYHPTFLMIYTAISVSEVQISVNVVDDIIANFVYGDSINYINVRVTGQNKSQQAISLSYSLPKSTTSLSLMQALYNNKAVCDATLDVESVNYTRNGETRTVELHNNVTINCDYSHLSGTERVITNALHLYNIRNSVSSTYHIANNINVSKLGANWTPIAYFSGAIYGDGNKISGMTISLTGKSSLYYGFIELNEGKVRILIIEGLSISGAPPTNRVVYVGGIAAHNNGDIYNCIVQGNISIDATHSNVGGIVGRNTGTLSNCTFGQTVGNPSYLYGRENVGGIVGYSGGSLTNCTTTNADIVFVLTSTPYSVGGLVGYAEECTFVGNAVMNVDISLSYQGQTSSQRIGWHIGTLKSCTIISAGGHAGCTHNISQIQNQLYCFAQYDGRIGRTEGVNSITGI